MVMDAFKVRVMEQVLLNKNAVLTQEQAELFSCYALQQLVKSSYKVTNKPLEDILYKNKHLSPTTFITSFVKWNKIALEVS